MTTSASALRAGNRQIVHGAIDREFADGAAGKTQRLHDKTIRGHRDPRAVDLNVRGVAQRSVERRNRSGANKSFDQSAAGLASGAVRHFDLRIAKPNLEVTGLAIDLLIGVQADTAFAMVTAFRCS